MNSGDKSGNGGQNVSGRALRPGTVVACTLVMVFLLETVWFVHRYATNALYADEFSDVDLITRFRTGIGSFGLLWAQHNENRVLFPRLVVLLLAQTTHLNVVVESMISAALWWITAVLLVVAHHRRSPGLSWLWYTPIGLAFASAIPLGDLLFGFNLSWFMAIASLAVALFLLDRSPLTWPTMWVAVVFAVIGSFSTLQGLLIWPAGLVLLLVQRQGTRWFTAWSGSAVVTVVVFFIDYQGSGSATTGLSESIRFFFSSLGNVVGPPAGNGGSNSLLVLGALVFAVAVSALLYSAIRPSEGSGLGSALITFGLLFAAVSSFGRAELGLDEANRYSVFILMVWCGSYLVFLQPGVSMFQQLYSEKTASAKMIAPLTAFFLASVLLVVQFSFGWRPGITGSAGWHAAQVERANVAVNADDAWDGLLVNSLGPVNLFEPLSRSAPAYSLQQLAPAYSLRQYLREARAQRVSLFATTAVSAEQRRGLDPHFGTAILHPSAGSTLTGTAVILDAGFGFIRGLKSVRFKMTDSDNRTVAVGSASLTGYGWIERWNTQTVSNGNYHISAMASYETGRSIMTTPVAVVVRN
jgi:hypothetical protein